MHCQSCAKEIEPNAEVCGACGTPVPKTSATISCPACGHVVAAPAKSCKKCGVSLQEQHAPSAASASPVTPPSPSARTTAAQPPIPSVADEPCPHCGAALRRDAKFCKNCGKSRSEVMPVAASSPPQATRVTPAQPVRTENRSFDKPPSRPFAPRRTWQFALVASSSALVLVGAGIGYLQIRKPQSGERAKAAASAPVDSAGSSAQPPMSNGDATPTNESTEAQGVSQEHQLPPGSEPLLPPAAKQPKANVSPPVSAASPETSSSQGRPGVASGAHPSALAVPPYQQAHENAEQALASARYIDPPNDSALYSARTAHQHGDPAGDYIEQQVLERIKSTIQAAGVARNDELATALLARLIPLFPDHPELQQMSANVRQDQEAFARQVEQQQKAEELQVQTKQFSLRHRHAAELGFPPVYTYCE